MKKTILVLCMLAYMLMGTLVNAQWTQTNGPYYGQINCLALCGNKIFAGADEGFFSSTDDGNSWVQVDSSIFSFTTVLSLAFQGPYGFAGTSDGLYGTSDSGMTWINEEANGFDGFEVRALGFSGNAIFAGTDDGVYASVNYGNNWETANAGMSFSEVLSFAMNGTTIYAGTEDSVYIHTQGTGWTNASNGLTGYDVGSLLISGNDLFAATSAGVFSSADSGKNWNATTNIEVVTSLIAFGTNIFAGTNGGGIYTSNNNGNSWTTFNDGLSDFNVYSFAINGTTIYAGCGSSGVWKRSVSYLSAVENIPANNNAFSIHPNPTTDKLYINSSGLTGNSTITVYNLLGQTVLSLPLGEGWGGAINTKPFPSGIYFLQLKTESGVAVKKFVKE